MITIMSSGYKQTKVVASQDQEGHLLSSVFVTN